ncbi:MAG: hypothetical protein GF350_04985 [Chitinivibrionales bacterium]|nr:hypothetical protein [Chitinivibrionales bacterium]
MHNGQNQRGKKQKKALIEKVENGSLAYSRDRHRYVRRSTVKKRDAGGGESNRNAGQ